MAGFVSRFAHGVTSAGEGLAAQIVDLADSDDDVAGFGLLSVAFPSVEPSPAFVRELRRQLMTSPLVVEDLPLVRSPFADRRVVYGVAAFGSLASAAVVVAYLLRNRGVNRAAA